MLAPYWLASDSRYARLALHQCVTGLERGGFGHRGDIADGDGHIVAHRQDRTGDRSRIGARHRGLDQHPLMRQIDKARAFQAKRGARRIGQVGQGETVRGHALDVGLDLDLADRSAIDDHMRHTRHRQKCRLQGPVGHVAQGERIELVGGKPDQQQVHGAGSERRQFGCLNTQRQGRTQFAQPLRDALPRVKDIDFVGELDVDHRQAGNGLGADRVQPIGAVDRVFDRVGDELLDLFGGEAGRLGLNVHRGRHKFGEHVQRRGPQRPQASQQRQQGERRESSGEADAKINQPTHG